MKAPAVIKGSEARPPTATERSSLKGAFLPGATYDVICFSHLRWDFVFQRPQHLFSRWARERRVFFIEEPVFDAADGAWLELSRRREGVYVAVPHLPQGLSESAARVAQQALLDTFLVEHEVRNYILWYYTPMAVPFTRHLKPLAVAYDCMDELSAFKEAPRALRVYEAELFKHADVVFTGGQSLFEAKRSQHPNVHPFPSSIDAAHFARARQPLNEPADQVEIPRPRLGFFGVIDERMDLNLLAGLADMRPHWHVIVVGPVVKIDPGELPRRPNIHYLGAKAYAELPEYLAGWDVALLPFACNEATRFISPTKTPEYLAAGKPVVSTSIRDVVRPYGRKGLVRIADTAEGFVAAVEAVLAEKEDLSSWLERVDAFLAQTSWDRTWMQMVRLVEQVVHAREALALYQDGRTQLQGPSR